MSYVTSVAAHKNISLQIKVPATSANMGPGFDVMGIAFQIYNVFHCTVLPDNSPNRINAIYKGLAKETADKPLDKMMPLDKNNLFWKGYLLVFKNLQTNPPPLSVSMEVEIPLTRGLGSSSSVILASMCAANMLSERLYKKSFSKDELLDLAIEIEGHPDNLTPAMLGGWVIAIAAEKNKSKEKKKYLIKKMLLRAPIRFAGIVPHQSLSTQKARKILPRVHPRENVIMQAGNAALYTYLLAQAKWNPPDEKIFSAAMLDILHQPYREKLIAGMKETFEYWHSMGCLGTYLSGAGTTLMGIWSKQTAVQKYNLQKAMQKKNLPSTMILPLIDENGVICEWK